MLNLAASIANRIIDAALSQQLQPYARLGEQEIASLFGCSRTIVREAMVQLAVRGIVVVSPRRGWFFTEVDVEKARELYDAREIIETGLLRSLARRNRVLEAAPLERLRDHLARQKEAVEGSDVGRRSYLLGDFHVCLAECLGNSILAEKLRDLTVLTTLFTMRHQTPGDARMSYDEHVAVVDALASNDIAEAERRMCRHLGTWETKVHLAREVDPLEGLRRALKPQDA
ncbi:GntR family transcriptional regulator [Hoeflea sp. 108]|jgi:DNA-binding GntR family transcriptional regulator|uniref:GntR family transcriptional regulator n=1 Tax=Hoeflea sp. 108 TaxID=1116369 RepID=UPI00035DD22F|nr:GntR family transcriptional regulator [Hoeflea sp. 108]